MISAIAVTRLEWGVVVRMLLSVVVWKVFSLELIFRVGELVFTVAAVFSD